MDRQTDTMTDVTKTICVAQRSWRAGNQNLMWLRPSFLFQY